MDKSERYTQRIATFLLILLGLGSVVIAAADLLGVPMRSEKNREEIILGVVGILCLSIGVERMVEAERVERRLKRAEDSLASLAGGVQLNSTDEIYESAIRLCRSARRRIRTVVFATGPSAPRRYAEAICERLRQLKDAGPAGLYEVVLACDAATLPPQFVQANDDRLALYEKEGVRDLVKLFILDAKPSIGLDVLIVDVDHIHLALRTLQGAVDFQSGIAFENQPKLASVFVDWFEQIILCDAVPYEEFRRARINSSGNSRAS